MSGHAGTPKTKRSKHEPSERESAVTASVTDEPTGTPKERNFLISVERGVLLRIEAAAILLGIGRTKMYELIRRGQIPVVRIGRRTLVHRADLEHFGQAQRDRTNVARIHADAAEDPLPTGLRDRDMS